jgi:carboxyl-terminal processing protease
MTHGDGERLTDEKVQPAAEESASESAPSSGVGGGPPAPQQPSWPPAPQYPAQPSWGTPPAPQYPAQPSWGTPPPPQPAQSWPPAPPSWQPPTPGWPAMTPPYDAAPRPTRLPIILSIIAVALIAFSAGMVVDHLTTPPALQQTQEAPLENFDVYVEALREIRENYVDRDSLTDKQLLYGSIRGMVDSLGDYNHSTFLTPEEYADLSSELSGSVAGIGVLITDDDGAFVVDRVIRDSPADRGGIKRGDRITAVDGTSVAGLDFDGLAEKVRGDVGSTVTVTVIHAGSAEPVDVTMTRAEVSMPLVDWGMIPGTTIADIALYEFSAGAADQVEQAIDEATARGASGIVLDLRGNPGGYAGEATAVLGEFVTGGVAYIEEDADGNRDEIMVATNRPTTSLPLVVLVDEYTASAAEVVAGCLQDAGRAPIVGMNTVGTGTILLPFTLSDGSVLMLGVVDWLTPNGNRIFGVGITPDTEAAMAQGVFPLDPFYFETMTQSQFEDASDAQLQKAIEVLQK